MPTDNDMAAYLTRRDLEEVLEQEFAEFRRGVAADTQAAIRVSSEETRRLIADDTQAAIRVISEENRAWFRAIDDQYKDLPGRVRKLEETVFPPPPRGRRKKAG